MTMKNKGLGSASISHIVACSQNWVIGKDNKLLWYIPEDLKRFKNLTMLHPVIMGRLTWESIPEKHRPLIGRTNIVISSNKDYKPKGAIIVSSINNAIQKAIEYDKKEIFIIGGSSIYEQTIDMIDKIYLTKIYKNFEGDSFYKKIDDTWVITSKEDKSFEDMNYSFINYERN